MSGKTVLKTLGTNLIAYAIIAIVGTVLGIMRYNDIIDGTSLQDYYDQQDFHNSLEPGYIKIVVSVVLVGVAFTVGIVACVTNSKIMKNKEKFGTDIGTELNILIWTTWLALAIIISLSLAYIVKSTDNVYYLEYSIYYEEQLSIVKTIRPIAISILTFAIVLFFIGGYSFYLSSKIKADNNPRVSTDFTGSSTTSVRSSDFSTGVNSPNASPLRDSDEW